QAKLGALEFGTVQRPPADPLWFFNRLRCSCAWGSAGIPVLRLSRGGVAGFRSRHRCYRLVRGGWAFRAGGRAIHGLHRLLLRRAHILLRGFQRRATVLFSFHSLGGDHCLVRSCSAPLRHVVGYSELLQRQASSLLDEKSRRFMQTILESAKRMGNLIDDLLEFSRIGRAETKNTLVSPDPLVKDVVAEIGQDTTGRDIVWKIHHLPVCYSDRSMLRLVIFNLLSNAVKFTRMRAQAEIEIGCVDGENEVEVFVRDNGAGFDMQYVDKLFGVFQRLHLPEEFEGTGIGLATVRRIIHRHGGEVRAEGIVDHGATFYFSLPKAQDAAERTANTL